MEEAGLHFFIFTAASYQVANKTFWLHFCETVMSSIFIYSLSLERAGLALPLFSSLYAKLR